MRSRRSRHSFAAALAVAALSAAVSASAQPAPPVFAPPVAFPRLVTYAISAMEIADVDRDGVGDVITSEGGLVVIRYMTVTGTIARTFRVSMLASVPESLATGDFDEDGRLDIIAAARGSVSTTDNPPGVFLLLQHADGTFGSFDPCCGSAGRYVTPPPVAPLRATDVAAGDLNEDGHLDLVAALLPDLVNHSFAAQLLVLLGDGGGGFRETATMTGGVAYAARAALADVDGDHHLDLITNDPLAVRRGAGDGTFGPALVLPANLQNQGIAAGDLDGDGRADAVAVGNKPGGVNPPDTPFLAVFFSHASGGFAPPVRLGGVSTTQYADVRLADVNGDGRFDIVTTPGAGNVQTFLNDGARGFAAGPVLTISNFGWPQIAAGVVRPGANADVFSGDLIGVVRYYVNGTVQSAPDTAAPIVSVPAPITTGATSAAGAAVAFTVTAQDDKDGVVMPVCTPASGSTFAIGTTTVSCSAGDAAGNTGYATFTVTVTDTIAPTLAVPDALHPSAAGPSGAVVSFSASAVDNVDGGVAVSCTPASGSTFALGSTTVSCEATDAAGNRGAAAFTVTVTDRRSPALSVPESMIVPATGASGAVVSFTASAIDNVDGSVPVTCTPPSGSTFPVGRTQVTCSTSDAAGNSDAESFSVTVADTKAPVVNVPAAITLPATSESGASVSFTASAADEVEGTVAVTCTPASGGMFAIGVTVVSCSAVDAAGNRADATFTITVTDTIAPVVTVPEPRRVSATGPAGAVVTFAATAIDNVDGSIAVACAPASGVTFPLGTTTVSCSATDAAGNRGAAAFSVTVADTRSPALAVPSSMTVPATGAAGAIVSFSASALDNVDGPVAVTCAPASGSTFPLGRTSVSCSTRDAAGNSDAESFTVTVVDTTAPVLTLPAALAVPVASPDGAIVAYAASAVDAVDGAVAVSCAPAPGSLFAPGDTPVSCSAVDRAGNRASGSFVVHVAGIGGRFDELVARSKGAGRGKSLERKAREARAAYLERAIGCACEDLDDYIREVREQRGKGALSRERAADLIARATLLQTLLDCQRVGRRQDARKHWDEDRDGDDHCGRDDDRRKHDRRGGDRWR